MKNYWMYVGPDGNSDKENGFVVETGSEIKIPVIGKIVATNNSTIFPLGLEMSLASACYRQVSANIVRENFKEHDLNPPGKNRVISNWGNLFVKAFAIGGLTGLSWGMFYASLFPHLPQHVQAFFMFAAVVFSWFALDEANKEF